MRTSIYGAIVMMVVAALGATLALIVIDRDAIWVALVCMVTGVVQSAFVLGIGAHSIKEIRGEEKAA